MAWNRKTGFTLIELVIAIAIFSLIGLASYSLFNTTFRVKERTEDHRVKLVDLQRAFQLIQTDVEQMVNRPVRDEFGDTQAALVSQANQQLEFSRIGWTLSPFSKVKRSSVQRVMYRIENGKLWRAHWQVLDRSDASEPLVSPVLEGVSDFTIRFLYTNKDLGEQWIESWPPPTSDPDVTYTLPKVVEWNLETEYYGKIRRLFIIAEAE